MKIFKRGNLFCFRVTDPNGERQTIATGTSSESRAHSLADKVKSLVALRKVSEPVGGELLLWVHQAKTKSPRLIRRLVELEFIDQALIGPAVVTLAELIGRFERDKSKGWKATTATHFGHTARNLKTKLGESRDIATINAGDADNFVQYLRVDEKLAPNTVNKRVQNAKKLFRYAIRHKLLSANPFADHSGTVRGNPERMKFIPGEVVQAVIDHCPDLEWKSILALCRWGGVRCPSEIAGLTWDDVDKGRERILIRSPKTERHEGKASRWIPLWPEIRTILDEAYAVAPAGQVLVCPRCSDPTVNLRTTVTKLIERAGYVPWEKLFQHLRSSRQTELAQAFPLHVVCSWIGNSERIAQEHYLQINESDFDRALNWKTQASKNVADFVATTASKDDALGCTQSESPQNVALLCTQYQTVGGEGLEPPTLSV